LTALQLFILRTIHRRGPQSEASLWNHSKCETLPAVVRAIATLAEAEFIELTPTHKHPCRFPLFAGPKYWQLTESGRAIAIAACNGKTQSQQQEVCLGS
jgi:hypothetical protein